MKKTIVVVVMVLMIATPCLAQEEISLLSVEGTAWKLPIMAFATPSIFAFNNNSVYWCSETEENGQNIISNCERCSTSQYTNYTFSCTVGGYTPGRTRVRGIILPAVGFGWLISRWCDVGCLPIKLRLITKINDNWTSPEVE